VIEPIAKISPYSGNGIRKGELVEREAECVEQSDFLFEVVEHFARKVWSNKLPFLRGGDPSTP
jgi:hypothetical protein